MIRAKFVCRNVLEVSSEGVKIEEQIRLEAVTSSDPTNAEWSRYTPSGYITMAVTNPAAWGKFVQGQSYFIDFQPTG